MFIDASALTAILTSEQDARELLARMQNSNARLTSPLAIWETTIAVGRRLGLEINDARLAIVRAIRALFQLDAGNGRGRVISPIAARS
ncbi:type II toxin-antitoxin system VapC family toxin [Vitreimonas sp.]|jgi:uncharacterized protein with PIN domain|uniref:type II toxin-antitoxin system VapC family toxin n=1 Tax=Vitreimonas sp. TaxID=3069702 RepID=UPI002EDA4974